MPTNPLCVCSQLKMVRSESDTRAGTHSPDFQTTGLIYRLFPKSDVRERFP